MAKPEVIKMSAENRETGSSVANKIRENERIPGIIYGPELKENITISVDEIELEKVLSVSRTQIIELDSDNTTYRTLLKGVEFHPVTDRVLHADFYALSEKHKVTLQVPIRLTGTAKGVTDGGGRVFQPLHIVRLKTLPEDIVAEYTLDVTPLGIGDSLHISDLELGDVTPIDDLSKTIVTIRPPVSEELLDAITTTGEEEELEEDEEAVEGEEGEEETTEEDAEEAES